MTARRQGVSCLLAPFLRPPYSYRRTSLVKEAEESILKRRPIQLRQAFRDADLADWVHKTARTTLPPPLPEAVYSLGSLREVPREHPHRQRGQYVYPLCPQARAESPQGVELTRHHDRQVRSHCMVFTFLFSVPRAGTSQHFAAVVHGFLVSDTSKSGSFYRTIGMSA